MSNINDALSDFTAKMAAQAVGGMGLLGYQDSPIGTAYSKDGLAQFGSFSWIARLAVEGIPEDCFKRGYQWVADQEQINAIEEVERVHKVKKKKQQAFTAARWDGIAYIYINTGEDAGDELILEDVKQGDLQFIHVLRRRDIQEGDIEKDPMSPNFGNPVYYELKTPSGQKRIHHSRIIRFVGDIDPATGFPVGVLASMLQPIVAAETARDNAVALTTEAKIDVMSVCGLMDRVNTPEGAAKMVSRYSQVRELKRTNAMIVLDKEGESYEQKQVSFATLPDLIESMRREVCAAIKRPYALTFGRNGSLGANGDVEIRNYYDDIATLQRNDLQPTCEVLDEVIIRTALGNRPEEIYLDWLSLWEITEEEKANIAKTYAEAAKTLVDGGIVSNEVLTEPTVNTLTELGAFQGIEQSYQDWIAGGGDEAEDDDQTANVIRPTETQDDILDSAK